MIHLGGLCIVCSSQPQRGQHQVVLACVSASLTLHNQMSVYGTICSVLSTQICCPVFWRPWCACDDMVCWQSILTGMSSWPAHLMRNLLQGTSCWPTYYLPEHREGVRG